VEGLQVEGEKLLDTSAFGLNICVVITQSFEKNIDNEDP
jgi:hypothetical protein